MQKQQSKIEEIMSLTLDHQKCMLEHLKAQESFTKSGLEVKASRYAWLQAEERLNSLKSELY